MDIGLGRFGDRRLEKGGPICWVALWSRVVTGFAFGALEAIAPARCGLRAFCAMGR